MADAPSRGHFVWHELMTTDTKSAAAFFTKMVGWKTQSWPEDPSYTMLVMGRPMAGLMALPDGGKATGGRPVWMSYINCPSVEDTARQATGLGGKVIKPPTDIPTIGRFAVIEDPQGAGFIAFTPLPSSQPAPASDNAPGVGDFSWHELTTTDWKAALTFYKNLFGWEETSSMDMGPEMGTYQMFGFGGKPLGGMFNQPKGMPGPPNWLPYIHVPDAKKTVETVKKLGGQILNGPMEVPGGDWIAQGIDPQGGMFAVHSLKSAVTAPATSAAAANAPAAKPAAAKAAKKSAARKPVAKKPAAKQPAPRKAAAKKPAVKKSAAKKSAAKRSAAKKSAPKKSAAKSSMKKPVKKAGRKSAGKTGVKKTTAKAAKKRAPARRR